MARHGSNVYRTETIMRTFTITAAAVDENFTFDLPSGSYEIAIVTDTNFAVAAPDFKFRAFGNTSQAKVSEADFDIVEPDAAVAATLEVTIAADTSQYASLLVAGSIEEGKTILLPFGLRIVYDAEGGTTGTGSFTMIAVRKA